MSKSAEYNLYSIHCKNITLLHCTFDCSEILLANEDSKCMKHKSTNAQMQYAQRTQIKPVRNNVFRSECHHKYCHRHKTKSNVNICTLKIGNKSSNDLFYRNLNIDGELQFSDSVDSFFLLTVEKKKSSLLYFSFSSPRTANLCVLCVNDWYFRSTSCPFATINIFALRICLQFFLYFQ